MSFYADSEYPVGDELDSVHAAQLANFARAGTWGTAAQRLAVISEARQAGIDAGFRASTGRARRDSHAGC